MDFNKYPYAKKFLDQHPGWTMDDCLTFVESEIIRIENVREGKTHGRHT